MNPKTIHILSALVLLCSVCQAQELLQQQNFRQPNGQQTLIVSQNPSGQGIRVIDRSTNRQLVDTGNLQELESDADDEDGLDDRLVGGLLEWFEKLKEKKRKKKQKKNDKQEDKQPIILPIRPEKHERKEIHIHINNHIKKHDSHKKRPQHHHQQKKHGHYEDYHEGHYDHDKHFYGKHSFPLLGHHFDLGNDYHEHYGSHYGSGHDDYSGHESKKVASYVASNGNGATLKAAAASKFSGRSQLSSAKQGRSQ